MHADRGLTGRTRARSGLDQALAAVRNGDTLVVTKLDRLARSVLDARDIADQLLKRGVGLALATPVYDPTDPMRKMFFNILATFAQLESDLTDAEWARLSPLLPTPSRLGRPWQVASLAVEDPVMHGRILIGSGAQWDGKATYSGSTATRRKLS